MIISEWLFREKQAPIRNKNLKKNPNPLKQKARDIIKLNDKELEKELAENVMNPFFFY